MDNLKIYLNTNNLLKVKGKLRDLKDGELIQARLMKSNLMISITDNPELFNPKFMYFKSLDSLSFRRFVTNYLYYKEKPGIVLTNINGTYYNDSERDEAHLKNVPHFFSSHLFFRDNHWLCCYATISNMVTR